MITTRQEFIEIDIETKYEQCGESVHTKDSEHMNTTKPNEQKGCISGMFCKIGSLLSNWFLLHWIGKLLASIFQLWILGDILSDVYFIWTLSTNGEVWWVFFSIIILYLSLRCTLVFALTFEDDFLEIENSNWRIGKIVCKVWNLLRKTGFRWDHELVEPSFEIMLLLYVPGAWYFLWVLQYSHKETHGNKCGTVFTQFLLAITVEIFIIPISVVFFSPFILMSHILKGIKGIWGANSTSFYKNSLHAQTILFYAILSSLFEAATESFPQLLLQTKVYWYGVSSIPPKAYYVSIGFSIVNIIKSIIIFIVMWKILQATAYRLAYNMDTDIFQALHQRSDEVSALNLRQNGEKIILQILQNCPNVQDLDLTESGLTDSGVKKTFENMKQLRRLILSNTEISNEGILTIVEHCLQLNFLDLRGTKITDTGLEAITLNCPQLNSLNLWYTNVTEAGVTNLLLLCNEMRLLFLTRENFTDDILNEYQQSYPHIKIMYV